MIPTSSSTIVRSHGAIPGRRPVTGRRLPQTTRAAERARPRRTREALIAAARRVFERDGFIDARITDIAEEAGAAHGTFYTYFDSKEAALRAVILHLESELLGAGAAQYRGRRGDQDPVSALHAANRRYLATYRAAAG